MHREASWLGSIVYPDVRSFALPLDPRTTPYLIPGWVDHTQCSGRNGVPLKGTQAVGAILGPPT